jgi:heme-degrading monooxygenase HmoA
MIVEYTRYRIADGRGAALVEAYEQAAKYLKESPHCISFELSQCVEEKDRYILRIEWKSTDEHLQGFRKEPGFKEFFQLVKPFFDNIEEMQHYEVTSVVHRL